MDKKKDGLRICSISDIHIGHNLVSAQTICDRLNRLLFPKLEECDILVLGGDITDTALMLGDVGAILFVSFFVDLYKKASELGVVIVLLEGTKSHERDHLKAAVALHATGGFSCPLYYSDKVDVTEIVEHGLKILFIPDDLPYTSSDECMSVVADLMDKRGWTEVDYAFVHGYFEHVLPEGIPHQPRCTFRADQFSFVKRYILVGHIHTSSVYENVIYNGSFDRLAHGEEESKGFIYLVDFGDSARIEFIENPYATPFITYNLSNIESGEEAILEYQKRVKLLPNFTHHIRVIHPSPEVRLSLGRWTSKTYPRIVYKHQGVSNKTTAGSKEMRHATVTDLVSPTQDNLPGMIADFLAEKNTPLSLKRVTALLQETA